MKFRFWKRRTRTVSTEPSTALRRASDIPSTRGRWGTPFVLRRAHSDNVVAELEETAVCHPQPDADLATTPVQRQETHMMDSIDEKNTSFNASAFAPVVLPSGTYRIENQTGHRWYFQSPTSEIKVEKVCKPKATTWRLKTDYKTGEMTIQSTTCDHYVTLFGIEFQNNQDQQSIEYMSMFTINPDRATRFRAMTKQDFGRVYLQAQDNFVNVCTKTSALKFDKTPSDLWRFECTGQTLNVDQH